MIERAAQTSSPDPGSDTVMGPEARFRRSFGVVIGVDAYRAEAGVSALHNAVHDASALGAALEATHGFEVTRVLDPTRAELRAVLALLRDQVEPTDRLLVYFAGHGVWRPEDDGAGGHLLLIDARRDDPQTFLPMRELNDALASLPCRHVLVILDCCFAGAFRWATTRDLETSRTVSRQRFDRFVEREAWQVITSTAPDQYALDLFGGRSESDAGHSPFAGALLRGLGGAADVNRDGLITATELYVYVRDAVERLLEPYAQSQTPGLFPLRKHDHGEFVFRRPGAALRLPVATSARRGA